MSFEIEDQAVLEMDGDVAADDFSYGDDEIEFYSDEDFVARGVDPIEPTKAKPGSEGKVLMLAARYAAGLPLWHDSDCYDHGPGQRMSS